MIHQNESMSNHCQGLETEERNDGGKQGGGVRVMEMERQRWRQQGDRDRDEVTDRKTGSVQGEKEEAESVKSQQKGK